MKIFPTKKQYKAWSLPSKLTLIGTYIGAISLLFSVISFVYQNKVITESSTNSPRMVLQGLYSLSTSYGDGGSIEIKKETDDEFYFELSTLSGAHECWVNGIAQIKSTREAFFSKKEYLEEKACDINFKISNNPKSIEVSSGGGCKFYCGMGATMDGKFVYGYSSPKQDGFFLKNEIVSEINLPTFLSLTKGYAEDFVQKMHRFSTEKQDGYRVTDGWVKGLVQYYGAIIVENDNGNLYAAVTGDVNENSDILDIHYFSTADDASIHKIVSKWSERYAEKNFIFHKFD